MDASIPAGDADVVATPDAADPIDDPDSGGQAEVDDAALDAAIAEDAQAVGSDAGDAGEAGDAGDAGDAGPLVITGTCPVDACLADTPCLGGANVFTCAGEFADFPIPARSASEPFVRQGTSVDIAAGLVFDGVTGLEWERVAYSSLITYAAAVGYCKDLRLGGHSDFRLPSVQELVTLYAGFSGPGVDTTVYLNQQQFGETWTSTRNSETEGQHWGVSMRYVEVGSVLDAGYYGVRCVRTRESHVAATPTTRFERADDPTFVTDVVTHLLWETSIPLARAEQSKALAEAHCAAISTGAQTFRLPTLAELLSFVDYSRPTSNRLPPPFTSQAVQTWTSTHQGDSSGTRMIVLDQYGFTSELDGALETARAGTRCVSSP